MEYYGIGDHEEIGNPITEALDRKIKYLDAVLDIVQAKRDQIQAIRELYTGGQMESWEVLDTLRQRDDK